MLTDIQQRLISECRFAAQDTRHFADMIQEQDWCSSDQEASLRELVQRVRVIVPAFKAQYGFYPGADVDIIESWV